MMLEPKCISNIDDIVENVKHNKTQYIAAEEFFSKTILFVEGMTDYIFYTRFLKKKNDIDVFHGKKVIEEVKKHYKNAYGIIDPDYKGKKIIFNNVPRAIKDRIHVIDANSLETLLVSCSDMLCKDMGYIFEKALGYDGYMDLENKEKIFEFVYMWSYFIGQLRKLDFRKKEKHDYPYFDFSTTKEAHNYLKDYVDISNLEFDKISFIDDLCLISAIKNQLNVLIKNKSNCSKIFTNVMEEIKKIGKTDIETKIQLAAEVINSDENLKDYEISDYISEDIKKLHLQIDKLNTGFDCKKVRMICQGHDIMDFIDCFFKYNSNDDLRTNIIPKWEKGLLKSYKIKYIEENSEDLSKFLKKIDNIGN